MPKKIMRKNESMTTEKALEVLKQKFGSQYEFYINPLKVGVLRKSGASGIAFKIKQTKTDTVLIYNPFAPNPVVRGLTLGIIPILILYATSWSKLQKEVKEFIDQCPDFQ
ncbi:MAG: hypothetical protein A2Y41_01550 [Spirochaetes bacterium GWB1_36_13]|nr:MAG: hypothetical protein A2Y41_01550 [Spirochaetes bacterium GWB1_36_13]